MREYCIEPHVVRGCNGERMMNRILGVFGLKR
jgi:hypothetical protein